ncbi:hypothetical protein AMTR_s00011p00229370 [Amborella trichopoda]|uniref:Uncharacterized protein n=1 Tax=Amborella trichopoda TaxID=13333 RepID=W1NHM5_AMBTC|nr:hypothetical protein AMTR_s00011p00229370 [Amborella trichopoda]
MPHKYSTYLAPIRIEVTFFFSTWPLDFESDASLTQTTSEEDEPESSTSITSYDTDVVASVGRVPAPSMSVPWGCSLRPPLFEVRPPTTPENMALAVPSPNIFSRLWQYSSTTFLQYFFAQSLACK